MTEILRGAIDLHLHTAPSVFPRYYDDLAAADAAARIGSAGFVIKAHEGSSAERAALLAHARPDVRAIGAVVCNRFVGGLNPLAVDVALRQGARVVWLPTIHAANHLRHYGGPGFGPSAAGQAPFEGVEALDVDGRPRPELLEIVELVRAAGAVLATGHLGRREVFAVVAVARERGVERIVITHPDHPVSVLDLAAQADLARMGAMLEITALAFRPEWGGLAHAAAVDHVRRIGAERFVLTSDLGQRDSGEPFEAFARECDALLRAGLAESELDRMLRLNPASLLAAGA